jgi:hypothetical protein
MRTRLLPALGLASALAVAVSSVAYAAAAVSRVSGPSPYASCTAGAGTGLNYVNTEVEPYVSVNPADTSNIVATWQQDRWSNGGAHGGAGAVSTNGGKSWKEFTLPFSTCAPGGGVLGPDGQGFLRASDFWVSFGPDGTAYASGLSIDVSDGRGGVAVATSHDGGSTWGSTQLVDFSPNNQLGPDKNSTTADPVHAGVAYTVWDDLYLATDNPDDSPLTFAYNGDAFFSKTTDGGRTWSAKQDIWHTAQHTQTIGNIIVVDPVTGTLYDFASFITRPNAIPNTQYNFAFVKSTDGGATWSQPQVVAQMFSVGDVDPNTGAGLRVGNGIPTVAVDGSGKLYAAWQDSSAFKRGSTQGRIWDDEIVATSSSDGGATWTAPAVASVFTGSPTYTPNIAATASGRLALTYYRAEPLAPDNTTTMPVDFYVTYSNDGGASFGGETRLMGPFNQLAAPNARGFFFGDYGGLAAGGSSFVSAFTAANCDDTSCTASSTSPVNAQDIFVATGL